MSYRKLLLKSIKLTLSTTIGCITGTILANLLNIITIKHVSIYIIGFSISFFMLTGISWLVNIYKYHINRKIQNYSAD